MAHRDSHMIPTPASHPLHRSNPPNPASRWHLERRLLVPTENTVSNHAVRLPNPPPHSGAFHGRHHRSLSATSSSQISTNSIQYAPYRYNQHAYVNGRNTIYPREENDRVSFKRKHPSTDPTYQNGHGYCSAGSNLQLNPVPGCCWPQSSTSSATIYPVLPMDEEYRRNVRRRQGDASFNTSWQASSNPSHQLCTSVNNSSLSLVGQWNFPRPPANHAHPIHPTAAGAGLSSFAMNYSVSGNAVTASNANNHGGFYSERCRNQNSILPTSYPSAPRETVAGPSRYNHRQISTSIFKDFAPSATGSVTFPRNLRPINRNGGLRILNEAHQSLTSEGSAMIDVPSFFNTLDLFDEYRDLRLDIDDMSYEELLALEDRIGKVNTGLSEDQLSLCLTKTIYCSSNLEYQFESNCPICLEEYNDKDNVGIMKCLHTYHDSCINDWLRIKNCCPICKSPALEGMS